MNFCRPLCMYVRYTFWIFPPFVHMCKLTIWFPRPFLHNVQISNLNFPPKVRFKTQKLNKVASVTRYGRIFLHFFAQNLYIIDRKNKSIGCVHSTVGVPTWNVFKGFSQRQLSFAPEITLRCIVARKKNNF